MTQHRSVSGRLRLVALLGGSALVAGTALAPQAVADSNNNDSAKLRAAVSPEGVMEHMRAFSDIAEAHDGNRASGTPGYEASRDYVVEQLTAAGYDPVVQEFDFPFFEQTAPAVFEQTAPTQSTYEEGTDYTVMSYSGSGDATAEVEPVDLALDDLPGSTSGCEADDFADFTEGNIALIRRGSCPFADKVVNAQDAGAAGAIIMNTGTEGSTDNFGGTLGGPVATIPAIGTSFALGETLSQGATVRLSTTTVSEVRETWNVIADKPGKKPKKGESPHVLTAGAHLDGVVDGPGMNDNASGSAALLEVAVQMTKVKPRNTVRFTWWGAEESGLLGSTHYVNDLAGNHPDELAQIDAYLNFDMVGSPNYGLFVLDGDNSAFPPPDAAEGPEGSAGIEQLFHDYFATQGIESEETPFSGRSDYGPFIEEDIAAGGLFTGHDSIKTEEQAEKFGGTAGEPFDPCYHKACDDLSNVSVEALDHNSDAMAHAIITMAQRKGGPLG